MRNIHVRASSTRLVIEVDGDLDVVGGYDLSRSVEQCFDGVTIQDIVARGERLAIASKKPRAPYVI